MASAGMRALMTARGSRPTYLHIPAVSRGGISAVGVPGMETPLQLLLPHPKGRLDLNMMQIVIPMLFPCVFM